MTSLPIHMLQEDALRRAHFSTTPVGHPTTQFEDFSMERHHCLMSTSLTICGTLYIICGAFYIICGAFSIICTAFLIAFDEGERFLIPWVSCER